MIEPVRGQLGGVAKLKWAGKGFSVMV